MTETSLEHQIDTNKDKIINDEELLDFLTKGKEDILKARLQAIGDYLNKNQYNYSDSLVYAKEELKKKIFTSPEINQKVRGNQPLTTDERNLVTLQYMLEKEASPANDTVLNKYLWSKFKNPIYNTSETQSSPILAGIPKEQLPLSKTLSMIRYREGYENIVLKDLMEWIKAYDFPWYEKERKASETRNREKDNVQGYVEYDLATYAFGRYAELIGEKEQKIQKEAKYASQEEFEQEIQLISEIQKGLEEWKQKNFPNIDTTISALSAYGKEITNATTKAGYTEETLKKDEASYKLFTEKMTKLIKEKDIARIWEQLANPEIHEGSDLETYFENINTMMEFDQACQKLKGKELEKYGKYMQSVHTIMEKYGQWEIASRGKKIDNYTEALDIYKKNLNPEVNWARFNMYNELVEKEELAPYITSKYKIYTMLTNSKENPLEEKNPFMGLRKEAQKQQEKQAKTDAIWQQIKDNIPMGYDIANFGVGAWNGLVDFTIGTGTSLGLMIEKLYKTDNERIAEIDRQQTRTNFLKIGQSSSQKEAIYEDGKLNIKVDNTVSAVGSQLSNMLALLSGAGAIGKGVASGSAKLWAKWMTQTIAQRTGLFTTAFIQQVGHSFTEGKQMGLADGQALSYTMLQSLVGSGLELISPNEAIMGSGKNIAKGYLKTLLQSETKAWLLQGFKTFGKVLGKEILEENLQEASQLVAANMLNLRANDQRDVKFDTDFNRKNFAQTALLTTLTTGLATSKTATQQGHQATNTWDMDLQIIKSDIVKNPKLYEDVMKVIGKVETRKIVIPNVNVADVTAVKEELERMKNTTKIIQEEAEQRNNIAINETTDISLESSQDVNSINEQVNSEQIIIENNNYVNNTDKSVRQVSRKLFEQGYSKQEIRYQRTETAGKIITYAENYLLESDWTVSPYIMVGTILQQKEQELKSLPKEIQNCIREKLKIASNHLNRVDNFITNNKPLIIEHLKLNLKTWEKSFEWNINIHRVWVGIVIFVENDRDFKRINGLWQVVETTSGGFNKKRRFKTINKTTNQENRHEYSLSVIRWREQKVNKAVITHEVRHWNNKYLFAEPISNEQKSTSYQTLQRAVDEIIAYTKDGQRNFNQIVDLLTADWGLYDYYKNWDRTQREEHKKEVRKLVNIVQQSLMMSGMDKGELLNQFTITPHEKWGEIRDHFLRQAMKKADIKDIEITPQKANSFARVFSFHTFFSDNWIKIDRTNIGWLGRVFRCAGWLNVPINTTTINDLLKVAKNGKFFIWAGIQINQNTIKTLMNITKYIPQFKEKWISIHKDNIGNIMEAMQKFTAWELTSIDEVINQVKDISDTSKITQESLWLETKLQLTSEQIEIFSKLQERLKSNPDIDYELNWNNKSKNLLYIMEHEAFQEKVVRLNTENFRSLARIKPQIVDNLIKLYETITIKWEIDTYALYDLGYINDLTKLKQLQDIGIEITHKNIRQLNEIKSPKDTSHLPELLKNVDIEIFDVSKISQQMLDNFLSNMPTLRAFFGLWEWKIGFDTFQKIANITANDLQNLQILKNRGIDINIENAKDICQIVNNNNILNINEQNIKLCKQLWYTIQEMLEILTIPLITTQHLTEIHQMKKLLQIGKLELNDIKRLVYTNNLIGKVTEVTKNQQTLKEILQIEKLSVTDIYNLASIPNLTSTVAEIAKNQQTLKEILQIEKLSATDIYNLASIPNLTSTVAEIAKNQQTLKEILQVEKLSIKNIHRLVTDNLIYDISKLSQNWNELKEILQVKEFSEIELKVLASIDNLTATEIIKNKQILKELLQIEKFSVREMKKLSDIKDLTSKLTMLSKNRQALKEILQVEKLSIEDILAPNPDSNILNTILKHIKIIRKNNISITLMNMHEWELMLSTYNIPTIREYLKRKNAYLSQHETLSQTDFIALFWKEGSASNGKFNRGDIHQTSLWYCYEYTANNLLKNANYFETLIRTSLNIEGDGLYNIKIPLWDPHGKVIKVSKQEISQTYMLPETFLNKEGKEIIIPRPIKAVSDSPLWFQIMEIAFIKYAILTNSILAKTEKFNINVNSIQKTYNDTEDFKLTGEILNALQWGETSLVLNMILWWKGEMSPLQPLNIENITHAKWLIELHSLATGREDSYRIKNNDIKDENWEVYNWLWKNHAYSLERKYQNKDGYWHFIVVNPHDTSKKIDMTEKQLMKTFQSFSSYTVDINQLFIE